MFFYFLQSLEFLLYCRLSQVQDNHSIALLHPLIHKRILYIIEQVLSKEKINLKEIEIITPIEKEELLYKFNDTSDNRL